jgi:hypothetical protein
MCGIKNSEENIGHQYSDENLEKKILDTNIRMKNSRRKYWMPIFG